MAETILLSGFGPFGEMHLRAWRQLDPDITVMVADPSEPALARARQLGIAGGLLASDPIALMGRADIVDVVAPPAFHLPLALAALAAAKPVMIEKPAVKTVEQAQRLLSAAGKIPVQIGLILRAHPLVAEAARLLQEGEIGELVAIDGDFSGWKRMRADSSLLENDGIHFLDLMRYFTGVPIAGVEARSWSLLNPEVADDIVIEIGFANGVKGRLHLGILAAGEVEDAFVPGALTTKRLALIGRAGNILIDFNRNRLTGSKVVYAPSPGGHDVKPQALSSQAALGATPEALLSRSFSIFRDAIRTGSPVMCDASQGALELAAAVAAIDAALAGQTRQTVRIDGGYS